MQHVFSSPLWTAPLDGPDVVVGAAGACFGLVTLRLEFDDGTASDRVPGTSWLAGEMMDLGTRRRTRTQMQRAWERLGATVDVRLGRSVTTVQLRVMASQLSRALALLEEYLLQPRDDEEEFQNLRREATEDARAALESCGGALHRSLDPLTWPGEVWGIPMEGTARDRARVRLPDLAAARARIFGAPLRLGIAADAPAVHLASLQTLYQRLRTHHPLARGAAAPMPAMTGRGLHAITHAQGAQAALSLLSPAPGPTHAAWPALVLLNSGFGSGFTSPLVKRVRAQDGLSYVIGSALTPGVQHALVQIEAAPEQQHAARTIETILACFDAFVGGGWQELDWTAVRAHLRGQYLAGLETARQRLSSAMFAVRCGLPADTSLHMPDRIDALDASALEAALPLWGPHPGAALAVVVSEDGAATAGFETLGRLGPPSSFDATALT